MSLSTCSRCFCRKSWDSTRYSTCEDCRRRRHLGRTAPSSFPISSAILNSAKSISASDPTQSTFRTRDNCLISDTKRRRFNADSSHSSKALFSLLRLSRTDRFDTIRLCISSSCQSRGLACWWIWSSSISAPKLSSFGFAGYYSFCDRVV